MLTATPLSVSPPALLSQYAADLAGIGTTTVLGSPGTVWVRHERGALVRVPACDLAPPTAPELRRLQWRHRAPLLSYAVEPTARQPANAILYARTGDDYRLATLPGAMRRNVARGLSQLRISRVSFETILAEGFPAYADTRRRAGLSDVTQGEFIRRFVAPRQPRGNGCIGAFHQGQLVAFLSVTDVHDWVEIVGCFSRDDSLSLRPNDTMLFVALHHYLVVAGRRIVSYGLNSVQASAEGSGLHAFKLKVGFRAIPVHRRLLLQPLLRPLAGVGRRVARGLLLLAPGHVKLRKAAGALALIT